MSVPYIQQSTNKNIHMQKEKLKNRQLKRFKLKYQYPARLSIAQHHQTVSRIYAYTGSGEDQNQRCVCCDLPCQTHQMSVCQSLFKEEQGSSKINIIRYTDNNVAILFYILKITTLFYFLRSLLVYIIRQTLLKQTKYCANNQAACRLQSLNQRISLPSTFYSNSQLLQMEVFISSIGLLVSILFYITYRYFLFKQYDLISASRYYQDQYTVFVDNISFLSILQAQISEDIFNASKKIRQKREINLLQSHVDRAALRHSNNPEALVISSLQLYFMSLVYKIKDRLQKKLNQGLKMSQIQQRLHSRLNELNPQNIRENILKEVVFCYDLTEILRLQELIEKTMLEIKDIQQKTYLDSNSLNYTPKRVNFLTEKQINLQKNYCRSVTSELFISRFKGCAFVSFQYSELKDYLLEFHQNNLRVFYDDIKFLKLQQAQAAQSVVWQNFKTSRVNHFKNQIQSILFLTFLTSSFVFLIVILKQFFKNIGEATGPTSIVLDICSGLLLSIFYNCILKFSQILGKKQSNSSSNITLSSRLIKSCIFALLLLIASIALFTQILIQRSKQTPIKIMTIFSFFVLFQTLYNCVPFSYILAIIRQSKYKSQQTIYAFQIQLNRQILLKQFDIVEVVTFKITVIFLTSFFSHYVSFRVISFGLVLLFNYWVFKLSLIKFYALPKRITLKLTKLIIQIFEFQIIIFTLGSFLQLTINSSNLAQDSSNYYFTFGLTPKEFILAQLGLALLYKILILFWPNGMSFNKYKKRITFTEAYPSFPQYYSIQNPATKFSTSEEPRPFTSLSLPHQSYQQNLGIKRKSTSGDKQIKYAESIDISKEYSTSKKRGNYFSVNKVKGNLK